MSKYINAEEPIMSKDEVLDELAVLQERFAEGMGWRDGRYAEALDNAIEMISQIMNGRHIVHTCLRQNPEVRGMKNGRSCYTEIRHTISFHETQLFTLCIV